jgi:hypothetical protein
MMDRCYRKNNPQFKDYGGRGITVCDRWFDFVNFLTDMGEKPAGLTLERRDNDKGYSPSNCYWATRKQQGINKRNTKFLTFRGETKPLNEWAVITGISRAVIRGRVYTYGWTDEQALSVPVGVLKGGPKLVTWRGKTQSLKAWAEYAGIAPRTLTTRIKHGWSFGQAITRPKHQGKAANDPVVKFKGKSKKLSVWCGLYAIRKKLVEARVRSLGWTFAKAITAPVGIERKNSRWITHEGKTLTLIQWSRATGFSRSLITDRIARGWSIADALTLPVGSVLGHTEMAKDTTAA